MICVRFVIFLFALPLMGCSYMGYGPSGDSSATGGSLPSVQLVSMLESDKRIFYHHNLRFGKKYNSASGHVCRKATDFNILAVKEVYCATKGSGWRKFEIFQ
jgi:hypothetical protein